MPSAPRAEAAGDAPKVRKLAFRQARRLRPTRLAHLPEILPTSLLIISSPNSRHAFALHKLRGATDGGENQSREKTTGVSFRRVRLISDKGWFGLNPRGSIPEAYQWRINS
jgi:hypothetical protein